MWSLGLSLEGLGIGGLWMVGRVLGAVYGVVRKSRGGLRLL